MLFRSSFPPALPTRLDSNMPTEILPRRVFSTSGCETRKNSESPLRSRSNRHANLIPLHPHCFAFSLCTIPPSRPFIPCLPPALILSDPLSAIPPSGGWYQLVSPPRHSYSSNRDRIRSFTGFECRQITPFAEERNRRCRYPVYPSRLPSNFSAFLVCTSELQNECM